LVSGGQCGRDDESAIEAGPLMEDVVPFQQLVGSRALTLVLMVARIQHL